MNISTKQHSTSFAKAVLRAVLIGTVLSLGTASVATAGAGNQGNPGIFPPQSHPYGKTYSQWAAAWWQWVYSIPVDQNPVSDSTGEFSQIGQAGPVFFLAGNFGGTTVRECTVPPGKALLIPLLNAPWVQFPTDPPFTIDELRAILAPMADNASLSCEIDGQAVQNPSNYREQSSVFSVTVPEGNLLGLDPGTYAPCVDDGYYLMLAPLAPGQHTIHLTAESADHGFSLDVTYHLTVK